MDTMAVAGPGKEGDGKILYHYTNAEAFLHILEGGSIWATDVRYLNDDQELSAAIDHVKSLFQETEKDGKSKILDMLDSLRIEKMNLFVCSFTENEDSPCMWKNCNCSKTPGT